MELLRYKTIRLENNGLHNLINLAVLLRVYINVKLSNVYLQMLYYVIY